MAKTSQSASPKKHEDIAEERDAVSSVDRKGEGRPPQTAGKLFRDIAVTAVVLGVGLGVYYWRVQVAKKIEKHGLAAKEVLVHDTVGSYLEAEKNLKAILDLDGSNEFALGTLAQINAVLAYEHGFSDRTADAQKYLAAIEKENAPTAERFIAKALNLVHDGKAAEASKLMLEDVINKGAQASSLFGTLGYALWKEGKRAEARDPLRKGADGEFRSPRYATMFGEYSWQDGEVMNARNYFNKALQAYDAHPRARIGLVRTQIATARGEELSMAQERLDELLALEGDAALSPKLKSLATLARAELALKKGQGDAALADADASIAGDGTSAEAHKARGQILAALKKPGVADAFEQAVKLDPFVPNYYYDGARAVFAAGEQDRALALLDKLPKHLEDDVTHIVYGELLKQKGDLDGALARFQQAIDKDETNPDGHLNKGLVLLAKGDDEKAMESFQMSVLARSYYPAGNREIGFLMLKQKKFEDGLQKLADALMQLKGLKTPDDQLWAFIKDVDRRLVAVGRKDFARAWSDEAPSLIGLSKKK